MRKAKGIKKNGQILQIFSRHNEENIDLGRK